MLPRTLLVATDFSETATYAFARACELAVALHATVHLVHCVGQGLPELPPALTQESTSLLRDSAQRALADLASQHVEVSWGKSTVVLDDPRDGVLATARALGADLIVMGTHGRRGLSRFFIGSVAEHVVRRATCPVLTVRLPES